MPAAPERAISRSWPWKTASAEPVPQTVELGSASPPGWSAMAADGDPSGSVGGGGPCPRLGGLAMNRQLVHCAARWVEIALIPVLWLIPAGAMAQPSRRSYLPPQRPVPPAVGPRFGGASCSHRVRTYPRAGRRSVAPASGGASWGDSTRSGRRSVALTSGGASWGDSPGRAAVRWP